MMRSLLAYFEQIFEKSVILIFAGSAEFSRAICVINFLLISGPIRVDFSNVCSSLDMIVALDKKAYILAYNHPTLNWLQYTVIVVSKIPSPYLLVRISQLRLKEYDFPKYFVFIRARCDAEASGPFSNSGLIIKIRYTTIA